MHAYILIETIAGQASRVAEAAREIPEVLRADVVMGPHDIIALVEGEHGQIGSIIVEKLRQLEGVEHTLTYMVVE